MKKPLLSIVVLFLMLAGTSSAAATSTIGILVFEGFLTSDVTAPVEVFGAAAKKSSFPYKVIIVSTTREKSVLSEEGLRIVAEKSIYDDLKIDVLIVPSSYKMDEVLKNRHLIDFVKKQSQSASWMASNCAGAFLLGEAGVLDGKQATTWAGGEKQLADSYPKVKVVFDRNVVVDDKVITSNGGPVSYQAAFELLAKLSSKKFADEISESIQFTRLKNTFK